LLSDVNNQEAAAQAWHKRRTFRAGAEVRPWFPARWIALGAACLAVTVLAVAITPRLLNRPVGSMAVASPTPAASPTTVSASNCTLPVLVGSGQPGYVNTKTQ